MSTQNSAANYPTGGRRKYPVFDIEMKLMIGVSADRRHIFCADWRTETGRRGRLCFATRVNISSCWRSPSSRAVDCKKGALGALFFCSSRHHTSLQEHCRVGASTGGLLEWTAMEGNGALFPGIRNAKGASLKEPSGPFNSSLEGNVTRAMDLREGDEVNGDVFKMLIRAAVALNRSSAR
jgi:hypothetical protein